MKPFEIFLEFRTIRLAVHLMWVVCFLWVGIPQAAFAEAPVAKPVPIQVKVIAPIKAPVITLVKTPVKASAKAPAKTSIKLQAKVIAKVPVKTPIKKSKIKVLVPGKKTPVQTLAKVPAPGKTKIKIPAPTKVATQAPAQASAKMPTKVAAKALVQAQAKAPLAKVAEVASIQQTGFGFSKAAQNLKSTVDSIMMILGNEFFQIHTTVRRQALWEILGQRIDFERMARRSLAGEWETRTPQEKKQFVRLFKKLLEQSYARWIEEFTEGRVHYLGERVKGKYAKIKTRIFESGQSVDVEYKMVWQKGGWKVYDFMVQGVSVVRNYRAQFSKVLERESYQGLLKKLKAQVG